MPLLQTNSINETKSKLDYIVCANGTKQPSEGTKSVQKSINNLFMTFEILLKCDIILFLLLMLEMFSQYYLRLLDFSSFVAT
jgi:hypothetical protein